jgi:hypothetical protein
VAFGGCAESIDGKTNGDKADLSARRAKGFDNALNDTPYRTYPFALHPFSYLWYRFQRTAKNVVEIHAIGVILS